MDTIFQNDGLIRSIIIAMGLMVAVTVILIIAKNCGKKARLFFSIVLTLVFAAALAVCPYAARCIDSGDDFFFAKRCDASVVSVKSETSENVDENGESTGYSTVYKTTVEYTIDGQKHGGIVTLTDKQKVGDTVVVYAFGDDRPMALNTFKASLILIRIVIPMLLFGCVIAVVVNIISVLKKQEE